MVQQLKDILNALYPPSDEADAPAQADAESQASEVAAPTEVGSPGAPAATADSAESSASEVAAPTAVGIETGGDETNEDGVVLLGTLPFSNTWPDVLKQCMESYDPQYNYQSCWVKGGGFVIGFKDAWVLEHVPAKCQFPLSVYVAATAEATASSTDAPASTGIDVEAATGDAAKGGEEPCGSNVDQMDTLPLESNDSDGWPPRPWIPKSSLRRWKPMELCQDN